MGHHLWPLSGNVEAEDDSIVIDGNKMKLKPSVTRQNQLTELGADIVIESTGLFTDGFKGAAHPDGGAKRLSSLHRLKMKI